MLFLYTVSTVSINMASSNQQKTDAEKKLVGDIVKMDLYGLFDVDSDATDKAILKAYR